MATPAVPHAQQPAALLLKELLRVASAGIAFMRGRDFIFEQVNQKFIELVSPRAYVGLPFRQVYIELSNSQLPRLLEDVYDTGKSHTAAEMPLRVAMRPDTFENRFYNFTYDRIGVEEPYTIICQCTDVTEEVLARRRAEAYQRALMLAQERLAWAVAVAKVGFYDWDIVNDWMVYSKQMMADWGLPQGSPMQLAIDFMHPDDRAPTAKKIQESIDTLLPYATEHRVLHSDGRVTWIEAQGRVRTNTRGTAVRFFGTSIDITERKRQQELLTTAIQARDTFLGIASHELRTPLTALMMQIQMTQRRILKDGDANFDIVRALHFVEQTDNQTQRLCRLVDDMLDASRIASGKLSIAREKISLRALINDVADQFRAQLSNAGCDMVLDIDVEMWVQVDPYRFEQVLANLLTNVIKYAPRRPVHITVRREAQYARVSVRDHGPGVAPDKLSKVFQRFERLGGTKHVTGLGLGLFISAEIVEAHGGSLKLESTLGAGCEFIMLLPLDAL